ncbi:alpha-amylase family glycosyl hydrolase [Jatrophihabitans sp.]|uniref:glycoside hydrolase family 13 protein n=1 Tax=Jatrophihabitans sp. TaxID=1932789 RepID=UPI0030C71E62|nr:alpha-amylase [Jatrophihabitans sp.]
MTENASSAPWWASAVFYQVYPRSFADGNGDGTGDLIGLRSHLGHLVELGVDALWLSPFYRSPMADGGYDVADPCDVDPLFGTLADFDDLLAEAHALGIRVTVDIVPNHFSDQHPWFQQALAAAPGSPERARFIFRSGQGDQPPNNWPSVFGGPAWTRVADAPDGSSQWFLHLFAPEQPDLDWTNPEVPAEYERVLRFWLDRGVDGFRIDVAHGMAKPAGLPDMDPALVAALADGVHMPSAVDPRWDDDSVHEIHRGFRRVLDSYPGARMAVGEAWVPDDARLAAYVRPDELNLTFNFELVEAAWGARPFGAAIEASLAAMSEVGAPCSWVLGNHDVDRPVTRYGDGADGVRRARAAALVQLSLPGAVYIYNGDELGLPNVELPDSALQDPTWERSGHTMRGRDGERVPVPWSGTTPPYGFSTTASTWLPMPDDWAEFTVAAEAAQPDSTLALFRAATRLRRELDGTDFAWLDAPEDALSYRRGGVTVVVNFGSAPVALPEGEVLLASGALLEGAVPADTAAWVRTSG